MAKRRLINTKFWSDSFIVKLQPLERYLFLYLLTNEHTEICGIYELSIEVINRETNLEIKTILNLLKGFKDRIHYIDDWVYIKNFTKNQCSNENMKIGAERSLQEIPPNILAKIKEIDKQFETLPNPLEPFGILKPKLKPKPKDIAETSSAKDIIISNLLEDKQKHIKIIGLYARSKDIQWENSSQQKSFIKRNLRASVDLTGYDIQRIIDTLAWLKENADFKWTLETVSKYIDEDLSKLDNSSKIIKIN